MKSLGTSTRLLPCKLTDLELQGRGQELAQAVQDRASEENRQVSLKAEMKARASELDSKVTRLSLVVARREEYRDVRVFALLGEDGVVTETREDTGEVIAKRPLRPDEQQAQLGMSA